MDIPQQLLNAIGTNLWICKYGLQAIPSDQLSFPAPFSLFTPYFTKRFLNLWFLMDRVYFFLLTCYSSQKNLYHPKERKRRAGGEKLDF